MIDKGNKSLEELSLEELELVDVACESVKQRWLKGKPTQIEKFVSDAPESVRCAMLIELVRTEVESRLAAGEQPNADEYVNRFPQWIDELTVCIDQALAVPVLGMDPHSITAISSRFEVLGLLGRGGMGVVVRARDINLDREVAVKLLAPELTRDPLAKLRFLREARLAAAVRHDNIVIIYSVDEINSVALIEMELIHGESLAKLIQREGAFDVSRAVDIATQIASGLEAAHARGMIHRDIKPANILLEDLGLGKSVRVKIADFGLARASSDESITQTGIVIGTPQFISPEQADSQPIDHRTDMFSLGSVMYSMCTGRTAFQAASIVSILRMVADREPVPIQQLNPDIPAWLIAIINKLMAKQPQDRFQSAQELIAALSNKGNNAQKEFKGVASTPKSRTLWALPIVAALVFGLFALPKLSQKSTEDLGSVNPKNEITQQPVVVEDSVSNVHPLVSNDYEWGTPVNLGQAINTYNPDENACISSDGLTLIFNRITARDKALFETRRASVNDMFEPAQLLECDFHSKHPDCPFLLDDGLSLYFGLVQPDDPNCRDLYVSKRKSRKDAWGPAISLGTNINTPHFEQSPWISDDELTLIFSRSSNGFKLYQATRSTVDEEFDEAELLANVNDGDCSSFPRLTQDGRVLLFVHCARGTQRVGLWIATRHSTKDDFSPPVELDEVVNSDSAVSGPSLSTDERTIYFSRRKPESSATDFDLWSVTRVRK